ncbi:unnamed protein product [Staurois parvus]|uniref:Uncharacterized protein n=1 Tax=Staurois parvus TaxID=386267 RepID=A0ABN9AN79_9NEOB|nr:unnamed protein product [Staurois parvus]
MLGGTLMATTVERGTLMGTWDGKGHSDGEYDGVTLSVRGHFDGNT